MRTKKLTELGVLDRALRNRIRPVSEPGAPCDRKKCQSWLKIQGPLNGGLSNRVVSRSGTCPSFFVLFCPFWDFPGFLGIFPIYPGIFLICPFPLSRPINSAYEEQSRKGLRHNLDLSQKKWETPRFSFSQKMFNPGLEAFNPGLNFQSRSRLSISVFLFVGPSLCIKMGSIENVHPRSIAQP